MRDNGFWNAIISVIVLGILIVGMVAFTLSRTRWIGPILIGLGLLPWIPLRLAGRSIRSTGADIIFGAGDTRHDGRQTAACPGQPRHPGGASTSAARGQDAVWKPGSSGETATAFARCSGRSW